MRIQERWSRITGCICSKGARANENVGKNASSKQATKTSKLSVSSSKRDEAALEVDGATNQHRNNNESSTFVPSNEDNKKSAKTSALKACRILSLTSGQKGAHVIAGWPSWLTAVAGEAINGWVPRRADSFEKLEKVSLLHVSLIEHSRFCCFSLS